MAEDEDQDGRHRGLSDEQRSKPASPVAPVRSGSGTPVSQGHPTRSRSASPVHGAEDLADAGIDAYFGSGDDGNDLFAPTNVSDFGHSASYDTWGTYATAADASQPELAEAENTAQEYAPNDDAHNVMSYFGGDETHFDDPHAFSVRGYHDEQAHLDPSSFHPSEHTYFHSPLYSTTVPHQQHPVDSGGQQDAFYDYDYQYSNADEPNWHQGQNHQDNVAEAQYDDSHQGYFQDSGHFDYGGEHWNTDYAATGDQHAQEEYHTEHASQSGPGHHYNEQRSGVHLDDIDLGDHYTPPNEHRTVTRSLRQGEAVASRQPFVAPDPHPIPCFAFGGRFAICHPGRQSARPSNNPNLSQIRVCSLRVLLSRTRLLQEIESFPGPLTKRSDVTSVFLQRATPTGRHHLLWQLLELYSAGKGSVDMSKAIALLGGGASGDSEWLDSRSRQRRSHCLLSTADTQATSFKDESRTVTKLQQLIISGQLHEAIRFATQNGLWAHALLLSQCLGDDQRRSVGLMFRDTFLARGSPLHTVYGVLSDNFSASDELSENWMENVASIISVPNAAGSIIEIGKKLLSGGRVDEGHACYLLAAALGYPYESLFEVIGLDSSTPRRSSPMQCLAPDAVQMTETYEHAVRQRDSRFTVLPLVAQKFAYACLLIDVGETGHALDYVTTVMRSISEIEQSRRGPPQQPIFSKAYCNCVKVVQQCLQRVTSGGGRIEKAGVFGSLFDNLSRFLIGNEDSAQRDPNSQPPVPIARSAPAEEAAVPAPAPPAMQGPASSGAEQEPDAGSVEDKNILNKLTGFLSGLRTTSPNRADDFNDDHEEKFVWDAALGKWVSQSGIPLQPASPKEKPASAPPPPRRPGYVAGSAAKPAPRQGIVSRYALSEETSYAPPAAQAAPNRPPAPPRRYPPVAHPRLPARTGANR
ncbi:Ancestral coatomer element 1 Sec16/Sec31 domain-containing protein [Plasmodiophora brassicae]